MDIEARNKFCGLLMFNTFSVTNKGPGSRTEEFAVNNYNVSSFSNIPDQPESYYYKSQNDPQETSIAAGAAAPVNEVSNQKKSECQKMQAEKRPPRPPNAFILYRREKQPAILAANRHLTNAEISRHIANLWRSESNETRLKWERYADQTKLEHMKAFPNYVYRPNKGKGKRRPGRKQPVASATSPSSPSEQPTSPVVNEQESSTAGPVRPSTRGQNRVNMVERKLELESLTMKMTTTDFQSMVPAATITPPLESVVRFDPPNMEFTDANVATGELQLTPITPVTVQQHFVEIGDPWRVVPTQPEAVNNQGNILFQPFPTFNEQTVNPSMLFINDNGAASTIYDHPSTYPQNSKNTSPPKTNDLGDTGAGFSEFRDNSTVHNPVIADIFAKFDFDNYFVGSAANPLNSADY